ncbi:MULTISPECIES: hypothetical protein [unclassified Streptomyces]|uniref:hypothetical protein n=1 Tax=Streptomyces TaxID=1883 RepID=UPI000CD52B90|nr:MULTISPECIES: hypothetical protein [unclassified Streptomyces]AWL39098.1 hypothetical protein B9S64_13995 [Streptomyces sp. SM18]
MLAAFIKAAHPRLAASVTLTEITDQVRLRKKTGAELETAARTLVGKARGKAHLKAGEFVGIAVHEDMDACPGPAYDTARKAVSAALSKATGTCSSAYALAAAESEAWLLLFPEAFTLYRPSWKIPAKWQGRDSGKLRNPKEDLEGLLVHPRFMERDGPEIVAKALGQGLLASPQGSNRSYEEFIADISDWTVSQPPKR